MRIEKVELIDLSSAIGVGLVSDDDCARYAVRLSIDEARDLRDKLSRRINESIEILGEYIESLK
jgi:hypothetical protein